MKSKKVNILDIVCNPKSQTLESIRISESESAILPFTLEGVEVNVHYCPEQGLGYVVCNEEGCPLCAIGRKCEAKILLPAFDFSTGAVGVLPVSTVMTPHALLPQLAQVMRSETPNIVFLTRVGYKFNLTYRRSTKNEDIGTRAIQAFKERQNEEESDLTSIYTTLTNDALSDIPEISQRLKLKEIAA
jgi:hypothetical protein